MGTAVVAAVGAAVGAAVVAAVGAAVGAAVHFIPQTEAYRLARHVGVARCIPFVNLPAGKQRIDRSV